VLNDKQKSYICVVFRTVDETIDEAAQFLDPTQPPSPFSDRLLDGSVDQHRTMVEQAERLRERLGQLLADQGISLPEKRSSSVWAARTAVLTAKISVEELAPRTVRGYGPLADDDCRELEKMMSELLDLLNRMELNLSQGLRSDAPRKSL
jgi:hypothetical protein